MTTKILKQGEDPDFKYAEKNSLDFIASSCLLNNKSFSPQENGCTSLSLNEGANEEEENVELPSYHSSDEGKNTTNNYFCETKCPAQENDSLQQSLLNSFDDRSLDRQQKADISPNNIELRTISDDETNCNDSSDSSINYIESDTTSLEDATTTTDMNYLRTRFQRTTNYDHQRSHSASRSSSSMLSNNTDRVLKEMRSKRIRAATAAQCVSQSIRSTVFNRDKITTENEDPDENSTD